MLRLNVGLVIICSILLFCFVVLCVLSVCCLVVFCVLSVFCLFIVYLGCGMWFEVMYLYVGSGCRHRDYVLCVCCTLSECVSVFVFFF